VPTGHYVRTIGPVGDRATETEVILLEHDIAHDPFTPAVLACLPTADWTAETDPGRGAAREDLRHLDVCSVDPPGCTDIDDALHVRVIEEGRRYQVGVRKWPARPLLGWCTGS
jgi:exosome complex exonuclease DIS3/RRP44